MIASKLAGPSLLRSSAHYARFKYEEIFSKKKM
jgi:hypothetical protein